MKLKNCIKSIWKNLIIFLADRTMRIVEKYLSLILGILVGCLFYQYEIVSYFNAKELIKEFVSIGTCSFGFLLTLFGLIIQSNSDAITEIRRRKIPYRRFVIYNRKVVFIALLLTIYSYITGYLDWNILIPNSLLISKILVSFFFCGLTWFLIEVIYFLIIFYILIQNKNDSI